MSVADALRTSPLFAGLSERALETVAGYGHLKAFDRGDVVFHQGMTADAFYVVRSGRLKVYVEGTDEVVLATLGPGDGLGEITVFDGGPRSASAAALEKAELVTFARSTIEDLVRREPEAALAFLANMAAVVRRLSEQAADLILLDLEGRVAKALLGFAGEPGPDGTIEMDLALSQKDLARMVGGARQSVNQILHGLESKGYLTIDRKHVVILDPERLRVRAEGEASGPPRP